MISMKMKKICPLLALLLLLSLTGCFQVSDGDGMVNSYAQITQDEAKLMMEEDDGHIIVDVRRQDEYDTGHIPGAVCIPNESIGTEPPEELPDKKQIILIYCRSGNRSKQAAQKLFDLGYVNVYEFGGIIDWTGEVVVTEAVGKTETETATVDENISVPTQEDEEPLDEKPVIYLYPEEETDVTVKLGYPEMVTTSYPYYIDGWQITARPDGSLIDNVTGRSLYTLYYESRVNTAFDINEPGFVVERDDCVALLEDKLDLLGLTEREAEEFIIYWLPRLRTYPYVYLRFLPKPANKKSRGK